MRHSFLRLLRQSVFTAVSVAAFTGIVYAQEVPVRVMGISAQPTRLSVEAIIEAVRQSAVAAQIPGRIIELGFDAGQVVRKGDVIARLDSREVGEAHVAAQARFNSAQAALLRSEDLYTRQFISVAGLDQARAEFAAAQAASQAAAAVASHAVLRAPFSGVVASRRAEIGQLAMPGDTMFTLYEPGALRAVAQVSVSTATRLRMAGAELRAQVELSREMPQAANSRGSVFNTASNLLGTRVQVMPAADSLTHVVEVRVDLPSGIQGLVPGSTARLHFEIGEADMLSLPSSAVVHRGGIAAAYVRDAQGRFQLRQLRLGELNATGEVEVLAGLIAGEAVALDPVKAVIERRQALTVR